MNKLQLLIFAAWLAIAVEAALAQNRPLTIPGSNANIPEFAQQPMHRGTYSSGGTCADLLQSEKELNALLQKKIEALENRLGELEQKIAKGEHGK